MTKEKYWQNRLEWLKTEITWTLQHPECSTSFPLEWLKAEIDKATNTFQLLIFVSHVN